MSVIGSNILAGASGQGGDYTIARSLRFRSSASAYLNRTPASNGTRTTYTISQWVKRGSLGVNRTLFSANNASTYYVKASFNTSDQLSWYSYTNGTYEYYKITTQVFRDPSAWYHLVFVIDTTNATASNRVKIYVNGVQVTSFATSTDPSQNFTDTFNASYPTGIGYMAGFNTDYFDGYLAEVNFIDGQALTPSSFGATNASTGVWQPKKYAGTYGTNGFYLPFTNIASTSTLGNDFSGNGNNWTTNNISLTAGSTYDSMTDVPTLTSATAANFATLNPIRPNTATISNANLNMVSNNTATKVLATIGMTSGKFYWECQYTSLTGGGRVGIATENSATNLHVGQDANSWGYQDDDGNKANNNSTSAYGASYTTSDVIGVAFDADNGTLTFYKNNTSQGTAFTGLTSGPYFPAFGDNDSGTSSTLFVNFGQRPFTYTPPTGFVALNTFNLPTPTIGATASTQANKYMDATLWTGNGTSQTITNSGSMQPDFIWIKDRSSARSHILTDAVRGKDYSLYSNETTAEATSTARVTAFNSNGFSLGDGLGVNANTETFVGWQWNAGGNTVTNTSGTISSQVRANTSAGFSVVTYTGTGSNATVGHGLGVAPSMVIVKTRSLSGNNWQVYHSALGQNKILQLDLTTSVDTVTNYWYNGTTSTVFGVNGSYSGINSNGATYVAYCFSEVAGYSKFGSYTGNGSTDGTMVVTGFRPKFILMKNATSAGESWLMWDTVRNTFNVVGEYLLSNASDAASNYSGLDILSNGFKLRNTGTGLNGNGSTIIYMAFAEVPFKYALAR